MQTVLKALIEAGAVTDTAGRLTLTDHEALYRELERHQLTFIAEVMVEYFMNRGINTVVGMNEKKSALALLLARALNSASTTVCTAIAMRGSDGKVFIPDHFKPLIEKQKVLIVDDFVGDPTDLLALIEHIRDRKGAVVGLSVIAESPRLFADNFHMVPYRQRLMGLQHLGL